MENTRSFISEARLTAGNTSFRFVDLPGMFGKTLYRLPVVLRLLLENVIRNTNGDERRLAVEGIVEWLENGTSEVEIAFQPDRVLMHDTTSTPALVDIAAMRDALPLPALGVACVDQRAYSSSRHRDHAHHQPRATGERRIGPGTRW